MGKEERQKHKTKKESLKNVEIKKTPVGGLKAKLQRRKTAGSSASLPSVAAIERQETGDRAAEGADRVVSSSTVSTEQTNQTCPDTPKATGLKAKMRERKKKQAAAAAAQASQSKDDPPGDE